MDTTHTLHEQGQMMELFFSTCKAQGLKITHQRIETYRQLLLVTDHPTAELLHKRLQDTLPTISLDTVYRTLTTLEQTGLVTRIQTAESQARFEAVYSPHHHLICRRCKQVLDFEWPEIDQLTLPPTANRWQQIDSKTIVLYGICNTCTAAT